LPQAAEIQQIEFRRPAEQTGQRMNLPAVVGPTDTAPLALAKSQAVGA